MTTPRTAPSRPNPPSAHGAWRPILPALVAMAVVVVASNILVLFPINDWLTWGAFTYPVAFLVTDLTNRTFGPARARQVVYAGFGLGVALSAALSLVLFLEPGGSVAAALRIPVASGIAFLTAQLLDVAVFDRLRRLQRWWQPPLASSLVGSALDTLLFFGLAFVGTGLPWITWGIGDFGVKVAMALLMLVPFGLLRRHLGAGGPATARG